METGPVNFTDEIGLQWGRLETVEPQTGARLSARVAIPSLSSEIFVALDSSSRRCVLVLVPAGEPNLIANRPSRGIAIETVEMKPNGFGKSQVFIEITCLERTGYAALDIVTIEILQAISSGVRTNRVRLVQSVLAKWRHFWSDPDHNLLSKEQHVGLFGELWFLTKWLIPSISPEFAVPMWRGPVGSRNDFEQQGWAIEVKTSTKLDGVHVINGIEQLQVPEKNRLFLFSLLIREEAGGANSLPQIVGETRAALIHDHVALHQFESMLLASGYDEVYLAEYEKIKFRIREQRLYEITPGFPCLVPSSFYPPIPVGVTNISYDLRLDGAEQWLLGKSVESCSSTLHKLSRNDVLSHSGVLPVNE